MPRTRTLPTVQETPSTHEPVWPEIALLGAYLVICLLSVLTVLLPTTENEEEHAKAKATPPPATATQDN
jgi:hypothetical protein